MFIKSSYVLHVQLSCKIMVEIRRTLERAPDLHPISPALVYQMCCEDEFSRSYMSICLGAILSPMLQSICLVESTLNSNLKS